MSVKHGALVQAQRLEEPVSCSTTETKKVGRLLPARYHSGGKRSRLWRSSREAVRAPMPQRE